MPNSHSMQQDLYALAAQLGAALRSQGQTVALAESCTGGWIAKVLTDVPGSSAWFDCGLVTYSNAAKSALLGVELSIIAQHGAVSAAVVRAMVLGTWARSSANLALAVSGIAGPDGGTPEKPVGTVYLAWGWRDAEIRTERRNFAGGREQVRLQTVVAALQGAWDEYMQRFG